MKKIHGFTLIEVILFIVISSILASTILLVYVNVSLKTPTAHAQYIAEQTAQQCMEWFIGQRRTNGYASLACPSTPAPSLCTAPSGFTISNSITCTTINSDTNYKTITVTVDGPGSIVLTSLIASY